MLAVHSFDLDKGSRMAVRLASFGFPGHQIQKEKCRWRHFQGGYGFSVPCWVYL